MNGGGWILVGMVAFTFIIIGINNDPMSNKWMHECIAKEDGVYDSCILADGKNCLEKYNVKHRQCTTIAYAMTQKAIKEQTMWERHANPERWMEK